MGDDPFYHRCCLTGGGRKTENRFDQERIEWHHNFIYAGKQVQEKWCILPIVKRLHDQMVGEVKDRCDWIMLNRATDDELAKFDRADLIRKRERLNEKYGVWKTGMRVFT
jgi:hypothetical protein